MVDHINSLDEKSRVFEDLETQNWQGSHPPNHQPYVDVSRQQQQTSQQQYHQLSPHNNGSLYIAESHPTVIDSAQEPETFDQQRNAVLKKGRKRASSSVRAMDSQMYDENSSDGMSEYGEMSNGAAAKQRRRSSHEADDDPVLNAIAEDQIKTESLDPHEVRVSFAEEPNSNQRPSYYSEGSRGPMKGVNSKTVELRVELKTAPTPNQTLLVVVGAILKDTDAGQPEQHQHFKTSAVGDTGSRSLPVRDPERLKFVAFKKQISTTDTTHHIKIDSIGVKRIKTEGRTIKLERKCRIMYRVYLVKQCPHTPNASVAGQAQIITGIITCEQPQGAPSFTAMTTEESGFEGGEICATRGKNLKGREDKSTTVTFSSQDGIWRQTARVFDNVTTRESCAFVIPPLPVHVAQGRREVKVLITPSVDGRDGDAREFRYRARQANTAVNHVTQSAGWRGGFPVGQSVAQAPLANGHPIDLTDINDVEDILRLDQNGYGEEMFIMQRDIKPEIDHQSMCMMNGGWQVNTRVDVFEGRQTPSPYLANGLNMDSYGDMQGL